MGWRVDFNNKVLEGLENLSLFETYPSLVILFLEQQVAVQLNILYDSALDKSRRDRALIVAVNGLGSFLVLFFF